MNLVCVVKGHVIEAKPVVWLSRQATHHRPAAVAAVQCERCGKWRGGPEQDRTRLPRRRDRIRRRLKKSKVLTLLS